MVNSDTCGYSNYNYERVADCTRCGKLTRNGIDTIHHSEGSEEENDQSIDSSIVQLPAFSLGASSGVIQCPVCAAIPDKSWCRASIY
jgi:hypothetical protein